MQSAAMKSKALGFASMLKQCCKLSEAQIVHALMIEEGMLLDSSLETVLISMYVTMGSCEDAQDLFDKSHIRCKKSFSMILSGYTNEGNGRKAIQCFEKYFKEADTVVCACALKACFSIGTLTKGKLIHFAVVENGFDIDQVVGNTLVTLYASYGCLVDAHSVFTSMLRRDVVSWCSLILGYTDYGYTRKALELFETMQQESIEPNRVTFLYVLRACASLASLDPGRLMHVSLTKQGLDLDVFIGSTLVDMYGKCKCIKDSRKIFDSLRLKNVVTWSAMISAYSENGLSQEALSLFCDMRKEGLEPDKGVYACVMKVCANGLLYDEGMLIHMELVRKGFDLDPFHGNDLVYMYSEFGSLEDANVIFDAMQVHDMTAWSSLIVGYVRKGCNDRALFLFDKMNAAGIKADAATFAGILEAGCHVLGLTQLVHTEVAKRGFESNLLVLNNLVGAYAICGCICDARCMFDHVPLRNVALWNAMFSRYHESGFNVEALELFKRMQEDGIGGNRVTALCVLKACSLLGDLAQGHLVHTIIMIHGVESKLFVENALISMYSQCGSVHDARKVFDIMPKRDVVAWSSIISVYAESFDAAEALELFKLMQTDAVEPNEFTFVSVLYACSYLREKNLSMLIHHLVIHAGFEPNLHIGSILSDVYAMCGSVDDGCQVFDMMSVRNVVLWSTILSLCVKHGYDKEVLSMFQRMQLEGIQPNEVTYTLALSAFANLGSLDSGKDFHMELSKKGYDQDTFVGNTLVDMYARSGSLQDAFNVLDKLQERTLVPWNTLISGLADHGMFYSAEYYLYKMEEMGIKADSVTFMSLLSACSHGGLIQESCEILQLMKECGVQLSYEHHVCLVDLLGRAGFLHEAEKTINELLVQHDWLIWITLLGSCAKYNDCDVGQRAFDILTDASCKKDAVYVLMSNIYSANKMWQAAKEAREMCTRLKGV